MRTRYFFILIAAFVSVAWLQHGARRIEATPEAEIPAAGKSLADQEGCAAGCAIGNHPIEPITEGEYRSLLGSLANGSAKERHDALETLLFHGREARGYVDRLGTDPLSSEQARGLRRELAKTHVRLWLRLVDERGVVRAQIDGEVFPIGERTHMAFTDSKDLQLPEASGTIHRTGLHHLWTRM